jgi:glycine dehydrogenase
MKLDKIIPPNIIHNINKNWKNLNSDLILNKNINKKCYLGRGFYPTNTPNFLLRHILENPKWYTAYTPYQAEISQGRLESLFNFQSMIADLTQMDISNSSLLDEATAINEAMFMLYNYNKFKKNKFIIDRNLHPQNMSVILEKSKHLGYQIEYLQDRNNMCNSKDTDICGIVIQNPDTFGNLLKKDSKKYYAIKKFQEKEIPIIEVSDLFSCSLFTPPGENNFDISVGSSQRFGLPMWYGGPHAGFISCKKKYIRHMPGRIVGKSIDSQNSESYRLTLQTREQHIKKDKATSNICTAQALLANFSAFYGLYYGGDGIQNIAKNIHKNAYILRENLSQKYNTNNSYFDTISFNSDFRGTKFENNNYQNKAIFSMNQLVNTYDIKEICEELKVDYKEIDNIDLRITRESPVLNDQIFSKYNDENSLTRYIYELADKDYSLVTGMIPLGSCTMKLNPSDTLTQLTNPKLNLHPYTSHENTEGYQYMISDLNDKLKIITGMDHFSFQLNSGSQGEYAGLIAIKKFLNDPNRDTIIIPDTAHGTNFASAKLAGYKIANLRTIDGKIDLEDLEKLLKTNIAALMITYPNTYGIFDDNIIDIIDLVHKYGAQVYMDGANMNAQLGYTGPGYIGADVCHLNLHKTFAIPHGGGGPGVGPIGVKKHLIDFLPNTENPNFSAAPYGSAAILSITWKYLLDNNITKLKKISEKSIYNANYLMKNLKDDYAILYTKNGMVAHEFIIDCSELSKYGIKEVDIAKRLLDYNFHAPTLSWPVKNSLMIEPTETENKEELDRFIEAMKSIKNEIINNPDILKNAPHSLNLLKDKWNFKYSIKDAYFPNNINKNYFPTRNRINEIYGDKNIIVKR